MLTQFLSIEIIQIHIVHIGIKALFIFIFFSDLFINFYSENRIDFIYIFSHTVNFSSVKKDNKID